MQSSLVKKNASYLKVLGHAKRLEIVCLLHGHELTVNQIVQMTDLRQATVSQHLMVLKASGLVSTSKIGKEMYYVLAMDRFTSLSLFIDGLTKARPMSEAEPTVIDPICKMHLTPSSASYTSEYDGVRHYFCGKGCQKEFHANHQI
ncbi:metalloregulator ArsR/SmtB family transcription factor [Candidatus Woesebacteria bacterium]|nr:metalloregulator ArsR/SmtB family transcription factor [Candidatus Woesebacteria bacterium]